MNSIVDNNKNKKLGAKDWKWIRLGEACDFIGGGTPSKKNPEFWDGKINWASVKDVKGEYLNATEDSISEIGLKNSASNIADPGDVILITRISPGKVIISNIRSAINQDLKIVKPKFKTTNKFIAYYFRSIEKQLVKRSSGTTVLGITLNTLNEIEIPVLDFHHQQAIVSKIEELFSELDKGVENLRLAQQQFKTYRQAVLKWAFEGRLTNEGGDLPKSLKYWKRSKLGVLCDISRGKSKHRPRNEPSLYGGKYPFIQTGDIRNAQGGIISEFSQTYSELGLQQSKLWPKGTLCITIAANIGETAMLGFDACFPDSVVGLLPNGNLLLVKFLNYFLISFKQTLESLAPATAQKNINVEILENVEIPICSLEEQAVVIQEIESRLSAADKLEETIIQNLQQADALRQSILKMAFEGRLAANDTIETTRQIAKVIPPERKILAGKIIHLLHEDKHFGLTKFQKVFYLVENFAEVPYETNFIQERAGPYDKEFTTAFRKEMQEEDWLKEEQKGSITKFIPGSNIGSLIKDYPKHFRKRSKDISFIVQQLKDKTTHDAELIATLYAVWNNRLIKKKPVKIELIVEDFFNWSTKKKEEFQKEEIVTMYKWMKKIELVPKGFWKAIGSED